MILRPTADDEQALGLARRTGWPEDLRVLIARYPRETWDGHANLGEWVRFWRARHAMFRELSDTIATVAARFHAGDLTPTQFPRAFVPRLRFLLEQLDLHHQIEDHHHFPRLRAADDRLARGFDVLEEDHHAIHADMAATAEAANGMLRALSGDADTLRRRGDAYADASGRLLAGLMRHLDDEEDLIVPLVLARGEAALGISHHG